MITPHPLPSAAYRNLIQELATILGGRFAGVWNDGRLHVGVAKGTRNDERRARELAKSWRRDITVDHVKFSLEELKQFEAVILSLIELPNATISSFWLDEARNRIEVRVDRLGTDLAKELAKHLPAAAVHVELSAGPEGYLL